MPESSSDAQKWTAPPVGIPCWIEIPASDVQACKVYPQLYTFVSIAAEKTPLQKFYAEIFPSWDFKPATKEYTDDKIAHWSFAGPSGEPAIILMRAIKSTSFIWFYR
jgi:hypothetical protein